MDDRARRPNLNLVKKDGDARTSSGVLASPQSQTTAKEKDSREGTQTASLGIGTGTILDGKYLVGRVIGSGAVGIVFEAKNVELDETVAIKCLRPEMLIDSGMVARFAREAKAAAAIKSEYVATVHDVGTTEDGVPYMVMEYLEGKDLGMIVAEQGTIGPRTAVEYALQVCEALAVAHSKGIVHRDIKPENLLLTERAGGMRIVKVLDFGISKTALTGSIFQNELPLVKTVNLMGTPLYMSPEQVRVSDSVDVRSDIWSLGMVIYEILTGETAFGGQSITEICAAILEAQPNPIELHRNDLPSGLVEVITKCLQKDVTKRYLNIAELALALMPFGPKRTRLNVERAVAVLQGSGQLDASVRVNSTMPPSPSDFSLTPIPRPPSVPGLMGTSTAPGVPSSAPIIASGIAAPSSSSPILAGTPPLAPLSSASPFVSSSDSAIADIEEPRKKSNTLLIAAIAVVLLGGGGAALAFSGALSSKPPVAQVPTSETAAKPAEKAVAPVVATPSAPATPAAAAAAAATPTDTSASPATTPAGTPAAKPAWATRPVTAPHPGAVAAPQPLSNTKAPTPGTAGGAKPKPSGKPGESEPDLGY